MRRFAALLFLFVFTAFGQSNSGELHLKVVDPTGLPVKAAVQIVSQANQYRNTLVTNDQGALDVQRLPFGVYQLTVDQSGFAASAQTVEIRSVIATECTFQLKVSPVSSSVTVSAASTLIDPDQAGSVSQVGTQAIQNRLSSIPGRSIQDLVNSQPGWLYEGNAVLHPRGSEYQTQFVVDGVPLTDNRSPSFGPEMDADDVQSMSIYTAGIPAEYGRKMGGVVEVNTAQDFQDGFHGQVVLSGGSFESAGGFAEGQYAWGKNDLEASASGNRTDHYLNPVVPQNFTNAGTLGDFSLRYDRTITPNDRISFIVRHELSRYDIPNELVQEQAGQLQRADNFETMGIVSYQHTFSPHVVMDFHGMGRDNANDFSSNANSTPIEITQHNHFREAYFKGSVSVNHGRHEWKAGIESDNTFLHENLSYNITNDDPSLFDPSIPLTFSFSGTHSDLEQAAFVQDLIHLADWTISAGLRWDRYQLLLSKQTLEPRLSISRYLRSADLVFHVSYDRIFQTPSFENILLSSSPSAVNLEAGTLQLPVPPSEGNYYEAGVTKAFFKNIRLGVNYFRRDVNNYADDDQIDNTTISFPISFAKAIIYGAEGKLDLPDWRGLSGFLSYSYTVGNAFYPVTGGLFLGALGQIPTTGHFPDSQDQRNTVRGRLRYQIAPRLWVAGGFQYDTGLPFQFECDPSLTLQQCIQGEVQTYGQQVINRINFNRGRIYPSFQVNTSVGADIYKSERMQMRIEVDGENLTNILDVIDFGGLFSGNAIGPSRSVFARLTTKF